LTEAESSIVSERETLSIFKWKMDERQAHQKAPFISAFLLKSETDTLCEGFYLRLQ
jgi:hypothetical protein